MKRIEISEIFVPVVNELNQSELRSAVIVLTNSDQVKMWKGFVPQTSIGADTFRQLATESNVLVDKSLLILDFLNDTNKVLLLTYPRRWGKTINIDMIKSFLELEIDRYGVPLSAEKKINTKIFELGRSRNGVNEPFVVWHDKDIVDNHFGRYPVISISFYGITGNDFETLYEKLKLQILSLYDSHKYLEQYLLPGNTKLSTITMRTLAKYFSGELSRADLETSLLFLSKVLKEVFEIERFIFIDEYDTPINYASLHFQNEDDITNTTSLIRDLLGQT
eukprot:gene1259-2436_t